MKTIFIRLLNYAMIVAAILGLIFSVVGFAGALAIRRTLVESINNTLDLLDDTLTATLDGFTVIKQSLDQASSSVSTLENTIQTSGKAIGDTTPIFDTLTKMVKEDLPSAIAATQTSLASAQASASLIEDTLTIITSLPLLPGEPYNPEVPLYQALGEVSESLNPLSESFSSLQESLSVGQDNLTTLQTEITTMAGQIGQIHDQLDNAQSVVDQYQSVVTRLHDGLTYSRESLPQWVNIAMIIVALLFLWLAITQIGLLTQGLERIRSTSQAE